MRFRVPVLLLAATLLITLSVPAAAAPKEAASAHAATTTTKTDAHPFWATNGPTAEPSAHGSNFFVALEPLFLQTVSKSGGQVTVTLDDTDTPGADLSLHGADGVDHSAHAPRASFGWLWNDRVGFAGGVQARFTDLKDATAGRARRTPGTTELTNFATTSETNDLALYTGDVEALLAYSRWGATLQGTYGNRTAHFSSNGETEIFGVFTPGNFVQLQFSNGSAFEGDGHIKGYSLTYRVPQVPVSVFVGRRTSHLEGDSHSFGRVVGSVAHSPSAPLVGAATVTRNTPDTAELDIGETRYGIQADFGAPHARFRSFARLTFERMEWGITGPPTGGAGFGGTIGDLTTNGFSTAGLGRANLEGWSLALGMAF